MGHRLSDREIADFVMKNAGDLLTAIGRWAGDRSNVFPEETERRITILGRFVEAVGFDPEAIERQLDEEIARREREN